jgi:hypothetical protein
LICAILQALDANLFDLDLRLGAQSAFEHGRDTGVADVIEAIELQAAGAYDLKNLGRRFGVRA